jgi:hypothetical protein
MPFAGDMEPFRYTEAEAAQVARLAQVRVAADSGNRAAKQKIKTMERQLAALKRAAKQGNARAARAAKVLEESGLLVSSQIFAMEGADPFTWKVGGLNVLNAALFVTAGVLAWKRRWGYAVVPLVVFGAHEGRQKRWW